jgi:catechol 2,3-dioxygenase-like lactoylglutathione lyase family enzyme
MIQAIDHLVFLVNDLEQAANDYRRLGFTVVRGGAHADGATHNMLIAFADGSYIELLAFLREAPEHFWWRHTSAGEGPIDYALLPGAIEADVAAARAAGLAIDGPNLGGRARPDGEQIAWHMARPVDRDLPFLCGDVTPRTLRVPHGNDAVHANGVSGIARLNVVVRDLAAATSRYQALLGLQPGGSAGRATFDLAGSSIGLIAPQADSADAAALQEHLDRRGEGLYAVELRHGRDENLLLNPQLTHNVRMALVP